jgi:hypothetical protein
VIPDWAFETPKQDRKTTRALKVTYILLGTMLVIVVGLVGLWLELHP